MNLKTCYRIIAALMVLMLLPAMAFAAGTADRSVSVGAKNFTEQYITGEMVALLLEAEGFDVTRRFGMSSFALRQAQLSGQVDISNDYTGTAWTSYLKQEETIRDEVALFEAVKELDLKENDVVWVNRMDLNNTYAMGLTESVAKKLNILTLEDLAGYVNNNPRGLNFAVEYEFFERPDGFFGMAEFYGFSVSPRDVRTMDLGLTYEALKSGDVDVAMVFTTDGHLVEYELVVLEDTKNFFPIYNLCNLINRDIYEKYPEIEEILSPMITLLDQESMTELNYKVDGLKEEPEDVAYSFLVDNGLL